MTYSQIRFNNKDLIVTPINAIDLRNEIVEKQRHGEQLITIPTAPINLTDTDYKHDESKKTIINVQYISEIIPLTTKDNQND